jgi:hypothetical protein
MGRSSRGNYCAWISPIQVKRYDVGCWEASIVLTTHPLTHSLTHNIHLLTCLLIHLLLLLSQEQQSWWCVFACSDSRALPSLACGKAQPLPHLPSPPLSHSLTHPYQILVVVSFLILKNQWLSFFLMGFCLWSVRFSLRCWGGRGSTGSWCARGPTMATRHSLIDEWRRDVIFVLRVGEWVSEWVWEWCRGREEWWYWMVLWVVQWSSAVE